MAMRKREAGDRDQFVCFAFEFAILIDSSKQEESIDSIFLVKNSKFACNSNMLYVLIPAFTYRLLNVQSTAAIR
jgi:hypothetical protein